MIRVLYFLPLLAFACLMAALYGAVHNQITYTVAPSYYLEFIFVQFAVDPDMQNRLGAALIGVLASWWAGLVIGLPLFLVGLLVRDVGVFWRSYVKAMSIIVLVALFGGLCALGYTYLVFDADTPPSWMEGQDLSDPVAFARADYMHQFSGLSGLIAIGAGFGYMIAKGIISRQR